MMRLPASSAPTPACSRWDPRIRERPLYPDACINNMQRRRLGLPRVEFDGGALGQTVSITTLPPISANWHISQGGATYAASLKVYL